MSLLLLLLLNAFHSFFHCFSILSIQPHTHTHTIFFKLKIIIKKNSASYLDSPKFEWNNEEKKRKKILFFFSILCLLLLLSSSSFVYCWKSLFFSVRLFVHFFISPKIQFWQEVKEKKNPDARAIHFTYILQLILTHTHTFI